LRLTQEDLPADAKASAFAGGVLQTKCERKKEWMMNISAHFLHTISLCEQRSGE